MCPTNHPTRPRLKLLAAISAFKAWRSSLGTVTWVWKRFLSNKNWNMYTYAIVYIRQKDLVSLCWGRLEEISSIIYIYIYIILLYKCTIYLQKYVYSFLLLKNPLGQLEVKLRDGIQPTIRDSQVLVPVNVEPCHMNLRVHPNISQIHFREKGPITFLGVMLNTFSQARLGSDTSFIEIHELLAKLMGIAPYSSSAPKKPLKFLFIL